MAVLEPVLATSIVIDDNVSPALCVKVTENKAICPLDAFAVIGLVTSDVGPAYTVIAAKTTCASSNPEAKKRRVFSYKRIKISKNY